MRRAKAAWRLGYRGLACIIVICWDAGFSPKDARTPLLEIHKLAYFIERKLTELDLENPLALDFAANKYGPYASKLGHLLNGLDGSYLHCAKRVADAGPLDIIWFEDTKKDHLATYLTTEAKEFLPALDEVERLIDGFETPLGMELLATVDWLIEQDQIEASVPALQIALRHWLGGGAAAQRKLKQFDDDLLRLAITRLGESSRGTKHVLDSEF